MNLPNNLEDNDSYVVLADEKYRSNPVKGKYSQSDLHLTQ